MNIEGKVADAGRYMKGYYNCEEANGKIPYAVLARNSCENVLKYIENNNFIHDIDFEREFEYCLSEITCIIYKWTKADGIFRKCKERIQIRKLDSQMKRLAELYMRALLMLTDHFGI